MYEQQLSEYVDGLPNISGSESVIEEAIRSAQGKPVYLHESNINFGTIRSAFANALHMHQPLIPAGGAICTRQRLSATSNI